MGGGDDRAVLTAAVLPGLPEVRPGDDLAALLAAAGELRAGDVLAVAHKVVSKAEGRIVALAGVSPGHEARALAAEHGKDPRHVQVILDESEEILRADRGRLICRTPPRLRVRQRRCRRLERRRAGHARAAARGPRRARPARCARGSAAPS